MKVLFICKGEYRYFFPSIARALRELDGCKSSAVTFTAPATRVVERTQSFDEVQDLSAFLKKTVQRFDLADCFERLQGFEAAYDRNTLNTMVYADRIISRYPYEQIIRMLAGIVAFWNKVIGELRPDAIIGEIASATEWIAWTLTQRLDIPYLIPYPTPVANRFYFIGEPTGSWAPMKNHFARNKHHNLSFKEAQIAESFVQGFRAKKLKPPFLAWGERSMLVPDIRQACRRAARIPFRIRSYVEAGRYEIGSYHGTPPWKPIWQDAKRVSRHAACASMIFEHSVAAGPYVYFPLHVQPEFTTEVRAPFMANQVAVIENISKSIPVSHHVLVKEHPGMKGERKLDYYRQLKSLHNVHLVSPSVDSHTLIEHSDAVITITGSTAWEAILYEKPVIALGPLCYGFYDLIYRCPNASDLPELIGEALNRFQANHDLLLKFVWSFLETAYEVEWGDPIRMPRILESSNVKRVAAAILAEISSRIGTLSTEMVPS